MRPGQVAVVGVPDARLGEVGYAFVVAAAGASPDPAAIISWCREEMANYKCPRHVEVIEALPLNARRYAKALAKLTGTRLTHASVGPARAQTITL